MQNKIKYMILLAIVLATLLYFLFKPVDSFEFKIDTKSSDLGAHSVKSISGEKDQKQTVELANGETLQDFGYVVKYLGAVWNKNGAILIFKRDDCYKCKDRKRSLVLKVPNGKEVELPFPIVTEERIRVFIGNCLDRRETVIIWFSVTNPESKLFTLAYDNTLKEGTVLNSQIMNEAAAKLDEKKCFEVPKYEQELFD